MNSIINEINIKGYSTKLSLKLEELKFIKNLIENQAYDHIFNNSKKTIQDIKKERNLSNYHLDHSDLDHSKIWKKNSRILFKEDALKFKKQKFFNKLNSIFGEFIVSDEHNLGYENFVWRIVRPNSKNDIGPPHRDCWFWNLNPDFRGPNFEFFRIKVWIPIYCEYGLSGLAIEPFSHKRFDIDYDSIYLDGIHKPRIKKDQKINLKLIKSKPGEAIIFHDKLLHCGMNKIEATNTRVSIEFTLLIKI